MITVLCAPIESTDWGGIASTCLEWACELFEPCLPRSVLTDTPWVQVWAEGAAGDVPGVPEAALAQRLCHAGLDGGDPADCAPGSRGEAPPAAL